MQPNQTFIYFKNTIYAGLVEEVGSYVMENKPPLDDPIGRIIRFQDGEVSRFLKENINPEVLRDIGVTVADDVLLLLHGSTKKGILTGLENYLKTKGREGKPLYPVSFEDIRPAMKVMFDLIIDESMQEPVYNNVRFILPERDAIFYSHYVSERYRDFASKESFRVYKEEFKECTLPSSISQSSCSGQNAHPQS